MVDVPQVEFVDNHIHIPVQKHRHVPEIQTIEKAVEVPYIQTVEKIVEIPTMGETLQGQQRATTVNLPPIRQEAPAEMTTVVEQGEPLPPEMTQPTYLADPHMAYGAPAEPIAGAAGYPQF